jgi:secreted trypsin-like serine protease
MPPLRCRARCLLVAAALHSVAAKSLGHQPWLVSLQKKSSGTYRHECTGTLIEAYWVLTLASCFDDEPEVDAWRASVHREDLSRSASKEHACAQDIKASQIVVHEDYGKRKGTNDVALVRLQSAAACAQSAHADYEPQMVATLDGAGSASTLVMDGTADYEPLATLGGGWNSTGGGEQLQWDGLQLQSAESCEKGMPSDGADFEYASSTQFCAEAGAATSCAAPGSALVLPPTGNEAPPILVGIERVAGGVSTEDGQRCVFVRVSAYDTWIFSKAAEVEAKYNYTERVVIIVLVITLVCAANLLALCLYMKSRRRQSAPKVAIGVPVASA